MGYTFLQKPSSFKFLSILEENCVAHINNGAIKCKFLLTNVSKNGFWVGYTFLQKPSSFKFLSILEENCGADINNGTIKRKFLLTNVSKNGRWASYTFLQKLRSFKFYCILVRRKLCCRHHYWKTFVENRCKNCLWMSYTF